MTLPGECYTKDGQTYRWGFNYDTYRYEWIRTKTHEIDILSEDHEAYTYDELVKMLGLKQAESIIFKQHKECKLFRCLECWMLIHPDDEIKPFKEGFVHKLCSK